MKTASPAGTITDHILGKGIEAAVTRSRACRPSRQVRKRLSWDCTHDEEDGEVRARTQVATDSVQNGKCCWSSCGLRPATFKGESGYLNATFHQKRQRTMEHDHHSALQAAGNSASGLSCHALLSLRLDRLTRCALHSTMKKNHLPGALPYKPPRLWYWPAPFGGCVPVGKDSPCNIQAQSAHIPIW